MENIDREDSRILTKLSTLMEIIIDSNDKRDKISEEQSKSLIENTVTLSKINDNLDGMNGRIGKLEDKMEKRLNNNIELEVEKTKGKFELSKGRLVLYGTLIATIGGLITTLVLTLNK